MSDRGGGGGLLELCQEVYREDVVNRRAPQGKKHQKGVTARLPERVTRRRYADAGLISAQLPVLLTTACETLAKRRDPIADAAAASWQDKTNRSSGQAQQAPRHPDKFLVNDVWYTPDQFHSLGALSAGAFGTIHLVRGRRKECGTPLLALKISPQSSVHNRIEKNRCSASDAGRTCWVSRQYGSVSCDGYLWSLMEAVPGGNLATLMIRAGTMGVGSVKFYVASVLAALKVVHSFGLVHLDLTPDKILLTARGHVKLADWGLGVARVRAEDAPGQLAAACFTAPEVFEGEYKAVADVWSVGCIMYEALYGGRCFGEPWADASEEWQDPMLAVKEAILRAKVPYPPKDFGVPLTSWEPGTGETLVFSASSLVEHHNFMVVLHGERLGALHTQVVKIRPMLRTKFSVRWDGGCPPQSDLEGCRVGPGHVTPAAVSAMQRMLCSAKGRATVHELEADPFFRGVSPFDERLTEQTAPAPVNTCIKADGSLNEEALRNLPKIPLPVWPASRRSSG
mmetsp:Transcript_63333/g.145667  ORF Transcript_63333/g.145667 Transcript_63333/m.145667 type:complete len:511 (-) Transcript_63333:324-1856(-)